MTMYGWPGDLLSSVCSRAQHLIIAAPYIKVDALVRVLPDVNPEASLVCITRWSPHDLVTGVSDVECRSVVIERGGSFRLHPSLHAKYYRADNVVLIGSANLTSSALGWTRQPNLEILCRPEDDFDADAFQRSLFEGSREIDDDEFGSWKSIANMTLQGRRRVVDEPPRLDTWRPATRDPKHLEFAYQGKDDEIASFDEQRAAQRDIQTLRIPPGLTSAQVRTWISGCLFAASFTNTILRLHNMGNLDLSRSLADIYKLSVTDARRDMETVQNWLSFLAPQALTRT